MVKTQEPEPSTQKNRIELVRVLHRRTLRHEAGVSTRDAEYSGVDPSLAVVQFASSTRYGDYLFRFRRRQQTWVPVLIASGVAFRLWNRISIEMDRERGSRSEDCVGGSRIVL